MLPDTCDVDIFEVAFANVGLCSDTVWTKNEPDIYKRVNRELWIKTNRLRKYFKALESRECTSETKTFNTRTVRDTIPFSNLAKYGNYKYDEQRENLYIPDESQTTYECICDNQNESKEPWMCPGVEEEFKRLTNASSTDAKTWNPEADAMHPLPHRLSPTVGGGGLLDRDVTWASRLLAHYPQLATALRPAGGHQESFFTETELEHLLAPISPADLVTYPPPRYCVLTSEEVDLQVRVTSAAVRAIWDPRVSIKESEDAAEGAEDEDPCPATSTPFRAILQDLGEPVTADVDASESSIAFPLSLPMTSASSSDTVPVYQRMSAAETASPPPLRITAPPPPAPVAAASPAPCFVAAAAAAAVCPASASSATRPSRPASPEVAHFDRLIRIILDEEPYRSSDGRVLRQPVLLAPDEIDWFMSVYPDRYNEMLSMNSLANDLMDLEQQMEDVKRYLAYPPTAWIQNAPSENDLVTDSLTDNMATPSLAGDFSSVPEETPERESACDASGEISTEATHMSLATFVNAPELPNTPMDLDTPCETPTLTPELTPSSTPEPLTILMAERDSEFCEGQEMSICDGGSSSRSEIRPRRRLYRDVLASAARNPPRTMLSPAPPPPPPPSQLPTPVPLLSIMVQKPVLETQPSSVSVNSGGTLSKSAARASRGQKVSPARRSSTQRATSTHKAPPRRAASAQKTSRGPHTQRAPIVQISHLAPSSLTSHDPLARDASPAPVLKTVPSASGAPSPAASPPATSTPLTSPRATETPAPPSATETPPVAGPGPTSPRSPRGETPPLAATGHTPPPPPPLPLNAKTQTFAEVAAGPARSRGPSPLASPTRQGKRSSDPLDRLGVSGLPETSLQRRLELLLKQAAEQLKPSESHVALRYKEHERPAAGALVAAAVAAAEQYSGAGRGVGRGEVEVRPRVSALPPGGVRPPSPPLPSPPPQLRGVVVAASKRAQSQHALAVAAAVGVPPAAAASPGAGAAVTQQKPAVGSRSLCSLAPAASPTRTVAPAGVVPPAQTSPRVGAHLTVEHGGGDRSTPLTNAAAPRRRLVLVCCSEKHTPLLPTDTSDSDEGGGGDEGGCGAGGPGGGASASVCGDRRRRGPRIELASSVVRHSRRLVAAVLEGNSGGAEGGDAASELRHDAGDDGSSTPAVCAAKESAKKEAVDAAVAPAGTATLPPGGAGDSVPTPVDSGAAVEAQALEHHPNAQRTQVSAEPGMQSADSPNDPERVSETWVQPSTRSGEELLACSDGRDGGRGGLGDDNEETAGSELRLSSEEAEEGSASRRPRTPSPFPRDAPFDSKAKKQESLSPLKGHVQERRCREIAAKLWKIAAQMGCGDQLDPTLKILDSREDILEEAMDEVVEGKEVNQSESIESRMCSAERTRCKRNSIKIALEKVYENCKWAENLRICKSCQRRLLAFENGSDENILESDYSPEDYTDCFTKTIRRSRSRIRKGNNCLNENIMENQDFEKYGINIWEKSRGKRKMRSFEKKVRCKALDLQWKDAMFTGLEASFLRELSIRAAKYKQLSVTKKLENLRRLEYLWQRETLDASRWLVPALAVKADLVFPLYCCEFKPKKSGACPDVGQDHSLSHSKSQEELPPPTNPASIASNIVAVNILVEPLEHRTVTLPCTVLSNPPPLSMISRLSVCTKLRHFVDRAGRKNADRWLLLDLLANRGSELRQERKRPFRACLILQTQALVLARNYRARMRCAVNAAVLLHIRPLGILRIGNGFACVAKKKNNSNAKEAASSLCTTPTERLPKATGEKCYNTSSEGLVKAKKQELNHAGDEHENQQHNGKRTAKRIACNFEQPLNRKKEICAVTKNAPKKTSENVDNNKKKASAEKDTSEMELRPIENKTRICVNTVVPLKDLKSQESVCCIETSDSAISPKSVTVEPITLHTEGKSSNGAIENIVSKNSSGSSKKADTKEEEHVTDYPNPSNDKQKVDVGGRGAGDDGTVHQMNDQIWKTLFPKSPLIVNEKNPEGILQVCGSDSVSDAIETNNAVAEENSNDISQLYCSKPTVSLTMTTELSTVSITYSDKAEENISETQTPDETSNTINSCPSPNKQDLKETKPTEVNLPETEENALSGQQEDESPTCALTNTLDSSHEVTDKANMSGNTSPCPSSANVSDISDEGSSRGTSSMELDESVSFDADPLRKLCSLTRLFRRKKATTSSPRILERGRKRKTDDYIEEVCLPKEACGDDLETTRKEKKDAGCSLQ